MNEWPAAIAGLDTFGIGISNPGAADQNKVDQAGYGNHLRPTQMRMALPDACGINQQTDFSNAMAICSGLLRDQHKVMDRKYERKQGNSLSNCNDPGHRKAERLGSKSFGKHGLDVWRKYGADEQHVDQSWKRVARFAFFFEPSMMSRLAPNAWIKPIREAGSA